jgi:hypothetical protein
MNKILRIAAALSSLAMAFPSAHAGPAEVLASAASTASGVVVKVEKAIERGARAAASGVERGVKAAASGVERGARAAASGVERGAKATGKAADKVAKKVGLSPASAPAEGK